MQVAKLKFACALSKSKWWWGERLSFNASPFLLIQFLLLLCQTCISLYWIQTQSTTLLGLLILLKNILNNSEELFFRNLHFFLILKEKRKKWGHRHHYTAWRCRTHLIPGDFQVSVQNASSSSLKLIPYLYTPQ